VERLAGEDGVDGAVVERDRLRDARQRLGLRHALRQDRTQLFERLQRDHPRVASREDARQLAGSRTDVEHRRVVGNRHQVEHLLRPARPAALVRLGDAIEAAGLFASRHRRAGTSVVP
jgi:hypothetical protein